MEKKKGRKKEKREGEKRWGGVEKKKGKPHPKVTSFFFPRVLCKFLFICASHQCICIPVTAQLLQMQDHCESVLAVSTKLAQTQLSAPLTWWKKKLCLKLEAPCLRPKYCCLNSCLVSFLKALHQSCCFPGGQ